MFLVGVQQSLGRGQGDLTISKQKQMFFWLAFLSELLQNLANAPGYQVAPYEGALVEFSQVQWGGY